MKIESNNMGEPATPKELEQLFQRIQQYLQNPQEKQPKENTTPQKITREIFHAPILEKVQEGLCKLPLLGHLFYGWKATSRNADLFLRRLQKGGLVYEQLKPFDYEGEIDGFYNRVTEQLRRVGKPINKGNSNLLYKWKYQYIGEKELTLELHEGGFFDKALRIDYRHYPHFWGIRDRLTYKAHIVSGRNFTLTRNKERSQKRTKEGNEKEPPFIWEHQVSPGHWSVGETIQADIAELTEAIDRLFLNPQD